MITLAAQHRYESEVKRSRFLASATRADDPEAALAFLEAVRFADATHNCWAYRVGSAYRFSDDGEPGGTAGRPILSAIEGQGVDHAVVVVARWFGGVKLGAGGLVRAYGGAAAECLRQARRVEVVPKVQLLVEVPFDALGAVYPALAGNAIERGAERYTEEGAVLPVTVAATERETLEQTLADVTRGRARVRPADDEPS